MLRNKWKFDRLVMHFFSLKYGVVLPPLIMHNSELVNNISDQLVKLLPKPDFF